jgi:cytochrome c6
MGVDTVTSMNQRSAGVQLRLKTDRGLISVHLGPAWYLEHQELQIKPGDLLEVQGVGWLSDDPPTLMATEVRKGDQVLVLRDTAGIPLWKGWRKLASTSLTLAVPQTVATANLQAGVGIFNRSCVACHAGGGNLVIPEKTLRQQDLQRYQRNSVDAIATQVRHGKNIMPAFQGKLTDQQIQDVTAYVLQQARQGWH